LIVSTSPCARLSGAAGRLQFVDQAGDAAPLRVGGAGGFKRIADALGLEIHHHKGVPGLAEGAGDRCADAVTLAAAGDERHACLGGHGFAPA
jgi:hypothetical protein